MLPRYLLLMLALANANASTVTYTKNPAPQGLHGTAEEIAEQLKSKRDHLCSLDPSGVDEDELTASVLEVFALHYQETQPMSHLQKYRILCKKIPSSSSPEAKTAVGVASKSLRKFYQVVKKYTTDVNEFRLQLCRIWKSIPMVEPPKVSLYDPCHEHEEESSAVEDPQGRPEKVLDELLGDILEASNDREAASYVMNKIIQITRSPILGRGKEFETSPEFERPRSVFEKAEKYLLLENVPNTTTYRNLKDDFEGIGDESQDSEILKLVSNIDGLEFEPKIRYRKYAVPCRKELSFEGCGKRQHDRRQKRIVRGRDALPNQWPWTVVVNLNPIGLKTVICGGVLISDRHVVTAGHCIVSAMIDVPRTLDRFSVKVGVLEWEAPVEAVKLKAFFTAPLYDGESFADDVGILELKKPVTFNDSVQPICLPFDFEDFIGQQAFVTGWGYNHTNATGYTDVLQETEVQVLSQQKCSQVLKEPANTLDKRRAALCAGYLDGRTDACRGDSGSPLMVETSCGRWVLIGVVSYGQDCGEAGRPGIYASVPHFRDWIDEVTQMRDLGQGLSPANASLENMLDIPAREI